MSKTGNRSAAGLRRSAVAEILRLRQEWSALKGQDEATANRHANKTHDVAAKKANTKHAIHTRSAGKTQTSQVTSDVLRGVVALVEVGSEPRALVLRAALTAMGATIVPAWSPLVTHLIWTHGGCRATRAKARALASRLVSPLWVEACAAANRHLPEQTFPAAARDSDLPSPRTLTRLLKKAEMENIPLANLLSDSIEEELKPKQLRISSETDSAADSTNEVIERVQSLAKKRLRLRLKPSLAIIQEESIKECSTDVREVHVASTCGPADRVNTAPRRALPASITPTGERKSKRKLFTQKELPETSASSDSEDEQHKTTDSSLLTLKSQKRRKLTGAERMVRRVLQQTMQGKAKIPTRQGRVKLPPGQKAKSPFRQGRAKSPNSQRTKLPPGQDRAKSPNSQRAESPERQGREKLPNGEGRAKSPHGQRAKSPPGQGKAKCTPGPGNSSGFYTPRVVLTGMSRSERSIVINAIVSLKGRVQSRFNKKTTHVLLGSCRSDTNYTPSDISGITNIDNTTNTVAIPIPEIQKARTVNALSGAARGCHVLYAQWAIDSLAANKWLHHHNYEVPHLKKLSQKARIERNIFKERSEYAYDVFNGMRVKLSSDVKQREAVVDLLNLCGAFIVEGNSRPQKGVAQKGLTQRGSTQNFYAQSGRLIQKPEGEIDRDFDITLGTGRNEVDSKWVFDSVAAARMRTVRRYLH